MPASEVPAAVPAPRSVPRYLPPKDAAVYSGIALKTLEALRRFGKGPTFVTLNRKVVYDVLDLDTYMAARKVTNLAEAHALAAKGVTL